MYTYICIKPFKADICRLPGDQSLVATVRCNRLAGQTGHGPGGLPPRGGQAETGELVPRENT